MLVVLVIFLFLRRFVATVIPTLSLPVSLIGAVSLLWGFGYSLDNISLLGLTLAVGLVVDDAIVMLENIMRHVEDGMAPFQAALHGSREVGFTIISISSSLIAVFIPIFFMPGVIGLLFHEFAVIVSLAIVVSAFVSLTLVPMLASRFLTDDAHKKPPGALVRSFERGFDALLARLRALARRGAAPPRASCCWSRSLTFVATAWLFVTIPKGFFPEEDIGQISVIDRGRRRHLVPGDGAAAGPRRRDACAPTRTWRTVNSFNGGGGAQNTGRMFINLKPRAERPPMKQVVEGLRRKLREVPGIAVYMRPIQNLQLGGRQSKAQYQYILQSVQADELNDWAVEAAGAAARRPAVPRRHQRLAAARPAGLAEDRPRPRQHARRVDRRDAHRRCTAPSASARCRPSTPPVDSYQVIMEVAPGAKQDESAFNNIYVRSQHRRAGAAVELRDGRAHGRADLDQPRRPAAGGDGVVQPRARRGARRRDREDRAATATRSACRPRSSPATAATPRCSRARRAARRS